MSRSRVASVAWLRIGAFDSARLATLRAPRTAALLDLVAALSAEREAACGALLAAAHEAVRGLDDRVSRRRLLDLQRDGHNGRFARLAQLDPELLPSALHDAADALRVLHLRVVALEADTAAALADEDEQLHATLAALARDPGVRDAIGGATPSLDHALAALAGGTAVSKARRDTENSIALYLARGAAKTSPLGRLGLTAPARLDDRVEAATQALRADARVEHRALLNLCWLAQLCGVSARAGEAPLALAEHIVCDDGAVQLLRRDEAVRSNLPRLQGARETVVKLKGIAPLLPLLARALPGGRTALTTALVTGGVAEPAALIERLVSAGLLQPLPPLPMQQWGDLPAFADALSSRGPHSARLAVALRAVADGLAGYARQSAADRQASATRAGAILSEACLPAAQGGPVQPLVTPCVFEDAGLHGADARLGAVALDEAIAALGHVLTVGCSFSLDWAARRTLAERIRRRFGAQPSPLLAVAMELLRAEQAEPTTTPNPLQLPDVDAFLAARALLPRRLRTLALRDGDGNIEVPAAELRAAWRELWPLAQPTSLAAAFVQVAPGARLVLGGATSGGGRLMSRFLASSDDREFALAALERHQGALVGATFTELDSVLAFNGNLHPAMSPLTIDYPGTPSRGAGSLTLSDLVVDVAGEPALPRIRVRADGSELALANLGFLGEALAPPLQRLLLALGGQPSPQLDFLRPQPLATAVDGVLIEPRLSVGALVVRRRSWRIAAAALPRQVDPCRQWAELRRLARHSGAPLRSFAVAVRRQANEAAATARQLDKPSWLDLDSPVYARLLTRLAPPDAIEELKLIEALPDPETDGIQLGAGRRAAEWVVELAVGGEP